MIRRAGTRCLVDEEDDISLVYEPGRPAFAAIRGVEEVLDIGNVSGRLKRTMGNTLGAPSVNSHKDV